MQIQTAIMEMLNGSAQTNEVETKEAGIGFEQNAGGAGRGSGSARISSSEARQEAFSEADRIIEVINESYKRNSMLLRALTNITSRL